MTSGYATQEHFGRCGRSFSLVEKSPSRWPSSACFCMFCMFCMFSAQLLHVAVSKNRIFNWLIYFWTDLHTLGVVRFSYFFFFYFLVWPHKTKILTKWTNGGGRVGTFISFSHSCVVQAKHSHFENICFRNYIICTFCTLTLCTPLLG